MLRHVSEVFRLEVLVVTKPEAEMAAQSHSPNMPLQLSYKVRKMISRRDLIYLLVRMVQGREKIFAPLESYTVCRGRPALVSARGLMAQIRLTIQRTIFLQKSKPLAAAKANDPSCKAACTHHLPPLLMPASRSVRQPTTPNLLGAVSSNRLIDVYV